LKKDNPNYGIIANNQPNKGKSGKGPNAGKEKPAKNFING